VDTKEGAPHSSRSREAHGFLRETRDVLGRARERIQEFARRLQQLTERSEALSRHASPAEASLLAELREREAELGKATAELRRQYEALVQAGQYLEHERARYTELFDNAPHAAVETDSRGVVREANRAFAALVAHPRESLAGKLLIAFVARGDTRSFRRHLLSLRDPRGARTFPVRIRPRGGAPILVTFSVRAMPGDGSYHWTLRPAASTPAEIRLLEILALTVNELRGPLTAALGWLQMMRERAVPEWERESILAAVCETAWTQSQLLDDVAEIVHARRSGPRTRRDLTTLTEMVALAAETVRPEALRRGVGVLVEQIGGEPMLECDEPRSRRIIARLLARAVETMGSADSGGQLRVCVTRKGDEAVLELHAPGVRTLGESLIGIAALTEALATDGGRLVVPAEADGSLLCTVYWRMRAPSWREPSDAAGLRPPGKPVSRLAE
jgi:PAS domain S-box-containing protein